MFLKLLFMLCATFLSIGHANAEDIKGVGVKKLDVIDPVGQRPMDAVAFFPSSGQTEETSIGPIKLLRPNRQQSREIVIL